MRIRQHLLVLFHTYVQLHSWLCLTWCTTCPRLLRFLVKYDDWLGPLIGFNGVLCGEFLQLFEKLWLLFHMFSELEQCEPAIFKSVFVQILRMKSNVSMVKDALPRSR